MQIFVLFLVVENFSLNSSICFTNIIFFSCFNWTLTVINKFVLLTIFSWNFPIFLLWYVTVVLNSVSRNWFKCFFILERSLLPCSPLHGNIIWTFGVPPLFTIVFCNMCVRLSSYLQFYLQSWWGIHLFQ